MDDSTISENKAGLKGGAVALQGGTATISSFTITGNTVPEAGAIFAELKSKVILRHNTFSGNETYALYIDNNSTADLNSNILLQNNSENCYISNDSSVSGTNNLIDSACGSVVGTVTTISDVLEVDGAGKAVLADNGCATETPDGCVKTVRLLGSISNPALNTGTESDPDQRGEPVFGSARDIGAYESKYHNLKITPVQHGKVTATITTSTDKLRGDIADCQTGTITKCEAH